MDIESEIAELPETEAVRILAGSSIAMVLTDPNLPDNPIVYVNKAFERVTGFPASFALGRNCRFLQGEGTDPEDVARIRAAITSQAEATIDIVNYRADGDSFLNRLLLTPITGTDGKARFYLGIQKELTENEARHSANVSWQAMRELKHRVKNHLAMIAGMVRLQARDLSAGPASVNALARRVESLQLLYEELSEPSSGSRPGKVALGAYLSRLANTTAHLDGRAGIRVNLGFDEAHCSPEIAAKAGLILSEVMNNAFQHAFQGRDGGLVDIRLDRQSDGTIRISVADDGVGIPVEKNWPNPDSVGGRVIRGLVTELGAELVVNTGDTGTTITLTLPDETTQTN